MLPLREHVPVLEEDPGDPETERYRFFGAITQTLNGLSAAGQVLLVIDDLHWADQPTLLLLRHVLRSAHVANIGVIAMYIDSEVPSEHRLRPVLADLRSDRSAATVHLEGLGEAAVKELAESASAPELATQLFEATDGNPMFLEEMLRQLGEGDNGDTSVPPNLNPTEAIRELVARRVSRSARGRYLPAPGRFGRGERVRGRHRGRGGGAHRRAAARCARPGGGVQAAPAPGEPARPLRVQSLPRARCHLQRAAPRATGALPPQGGGGHGAGPRDRARELRQRAGPPLLHGCRARRRGQGHPLRHARRRRALRLLAFEEAVGHFARSLEVAEQFGDHDQSLRCDALIALAEAQNRAGDNETAEANFERAATLARAIGDPERLASAALRAGPLNGLGPVVTNAEQVRLLEEALALLPEEDSHLRAMVMARLGLVLVYSVAVPGPTVVKHALQLDTEAVQMARRLNDRSTLAYALNACIHALWGIAAAPERLAAGRELGEIAEDVGDELLAVHGHMWRVRELLARGDVDAVSDELSQFAARDTAPPHPLVVSLSSNLAAMMALVTGEFDDADRFARTALETGEGYNDMALSFYGVLMAWTWWQRDDLTTLGETVRSVLAGSTEEFPILRGALALVGAESGDTEAALAELDFLADLGWDRVGDDLTEGASLAFAAAACGTLGQAAHSHALNVYEELRPYAGTALVLRSPAAACVGPADQYLGLLAAAMGDLALAEVHFEAALRLALRMRAKPFLVAAEVELARASASAAGKGTRSASPSSCATPRSRRSPWVCTGSSAGRRNRAEPSPPHQGVAAPPSACRRSSFSA